MTTQKQDLVTVIATRAKAIDFWSFMHYLPNPDPVLKKMGKDISAYREILSDSHVGFDRTFRPLTGEPNHQPNFRCHAVWLPSFGSDVGKPKRLIITCCCGG